MAGLLSAIDGYRGSNIVRAALRLAPLWFVRPGELRRARWEDFDMDAAQWSFVVSKTRHEHVVPLATQAIKILEELRPTHVAANIFSRVSGTSTGPSARIRLRWL